MDVHVSRVAPDAAYAAAHLALLDALACAFKALQDPACGSLLGALVPGATMAFGARVPGTSYQLDPVHAAFNIGTMIGWLEQCDDAFASECGHLSDNLGAILAVADYRARKALAEGVTPPTVRDLFAAMIQAHEHAAREWVRSTREGQAAWPPRAVPDRADAFARCGLTRIASAAAAVTLFGGSEEQLATAVAFARSESMANPHECRAPGYDGHDRWQLGDATGRGVRLALVALARSDVRRLSEPPVALDGEGQADGLPGLERIWGNADPVSEVATRAQDRFATAVAVHFPVVQAARIVALFADRTRLEALPVNELVSMTVRN